MNRDILLYRLCPVHRIYDCCNSDTNFVCKDCIRVMNERLDEYDNHVIEQYKANTRLNDTIREIHDNVAKEMYCKGVEHFAFLMKEALNYDWATTKISEQIIYNRLYDECDRIAEKLKAGGKNE